MATNDKQPLGSPQKFRTACNRTIVLSQKSLAHLEAHPEVMNVLPEAIGQARLPAGDFVQMEIELGRVLGRQGRVETAPCDLTTKILFSIRKNRDKPTRVAPDGLIGEETTSVAMLALQNRDDPQTYVLVTAWLGKLACKEPWDTKIKTEAEYQDCLRFWSSHALIHDPEVMGEVFTSTWEQVLGQPRRFA